MRPKTLQIAHCTTCETGFSTLSAQKAEAWGVGHVQHMLLVQRRQHVVDVFTVQVERPELILGRR